MKIAKLLELHRQNNAQQGLAKNWGDGFLLNHNRIYRNIRKSAAANGYHFSDAANANYQALPFSQLENILSKKIIPYFDNVTILDQLVKQVPGSSWEDLSGGLKKNYIFHESCHAVARSAALEILKIPVAPFGVESLRQRTLQILLEESFANTCELIAVVDAQDAAHRIFYEWNSYTSLFEERSNIKQLMAEVGGEIVFRFLHLCYLHANFLVVKLDQKQFDQCITIATGRSRKVLEAKHVKGLKALAKIGFTLDLEFRTVTTRFHLQLNGFKIDQAKLLEFDFLTSMMAEEKFSSFLSSITEAALK
jgi:hypothetical protein